MFLLDFDSNDLAANRNGQLSERQLERLRGRRRASVIAAMAIVLVAAAVAALFIFWGQVSSSAVLMIVGVGVTLVAAAISGIFARYWMRLTADIDSGAAQVLTGDLERVLKPISRRSATYVLRIGGQDIATSKETFKAFKHNAPYRLYITKYSRVLLSAEAV